MVYDLPMDESGNREVHLVGTVYTDTGPGTIEHRNSRFSGHLQSCGALANCRCTKRGEIISQLKFATGYGKPEVVLN
jgi:hypothetical protein